MTSDHGKKKEVQGEEKGNGGYALGSHSSNSFCSELNG